MGKILIVDDAEFMRVTLSAIFTRANYEIVGTAVNRREAIQFFKETNPDIIITDITMPIMNRLEAIQVMMTSDDHARIIACSVMGQQKIVVGAVDVIAKPFHDAGVLETLKHVLNTHHQTTDVHNNVNIF